MSDVQNNHNTEEINNNLDWFDEKYLEKILSHHHEGKLIKIINFTKELATKKGENYASLMHLIKAEYKSRNEEHNNTEVGKKISLIIKSRSDNEALSEIGEELNVFTRETQVYKLILNKCEELLEVSDANCKNLSVPPIKFGPKAIYIDDRIIVQENLKERGYAIEDIKNGLNFQECCLVLEKLAKFHACTTILNEKKPEIFRYHRNSNISEIYTPLHDVFKLTMDTCVEYLKTIPDLQEYVPKLQKYKEDLIPKISRIFTRNENEFNCLNHGDVWVNNLMFKKDSNGNPLDVLFVDYQEGYFGSPGIDWNYFIFTSWQSDIYLKRKTDLIKFYHKVLIDTLRILKYDERKLPKLEDIENEIQSKGDHGLTTVTCILPILINEHPELVDVSTFITDTEETRKKRLQVFDNPKYTNLLRIYLRDFVKKGIL